MTGNELRIKRKSMGMTQAQFAQYLGVSQEMVSEMESGVKAVPNSVAKKLTVGQ